TRFMSCCSPLWLLISLARTCPVPIAATTRITARYTCLRVTADRIPDSDMAPPLERSGRQPPARPTRLTSRACLCVLSACRASPARVFHAVLDARGDSRGGDHGELQNVHGACPL